MTGEILNTNGILVYDWWEFLKIIVRKTIGQLENQLKPRFSTVFFVEIGF